ncbi:MAG: CocE/NonD family hydrolase C-terminal non-catalytic domain-containing protein, partial [Jiangellaceae bacterium]
YISSGYPDTRQYCIDTVRVGEMNAHQDRVSGDYNDFWAGRDYINAVKKVKAATLMAHAFNDWNVVPEHSVRISQELERWGVPLQQYFHQGGHGGFGAFFLQNRWFTRYLYGVDNGVENDPKAWIVREGASQANPTPYENYPNPAAAPVTLTLQEGGATAGDLTSLALPAAAAETLVDAGNVACNAGNLATTVSTHRLLYTTPVLTQNLHTSGTASVTVRLASSKPAANLSVALVKLPWTSASGCTSSTRGSTTSIVTRGWADPQNHASLTNGRPLTPGTFDDVTFDLQPDDQVLPAGSRLGLMIFSTDAEFTLRPQPGTELSVDLSGTSVELPVVGGRLAMPICAEPDARATVIVGDVDSGVPNHTVAGGCTINDHVLDDQEWGNHGQFVLHVEEVADLLMAADLITARERAALVSAAARSDVGS